MIIFSLLVSLVALIASWMLKTKGFVGRYSQAGFLVKSIGLSSTILIIVGIVLTISSYLSDESYRDSGLSISMLIVGVSLYLIAVIMGEGRNR